MNSETLKAHKMNKSLILEALSQAGADLSRGDRSFCCPFHQERNPSAGVFEADDGWRFKCHGCGKGGDVFDVRSWIDGKPVGDVLKESSPQQEKPAKAISSPPDESKSEKAVKIAEKRQNALYASVSEMRESLQRRESAQGGKVVAAYEYTNPSTQAVELVVLRIEYSNGKKTFRQAHQTPNGFVMTAPEGKLPLYNRTRLLAAKSVIVVEGEKCVHALTKLGFTATTAPGGALKGDKADWSPLAGKMVYLWPDNDPLDDKGICKGLKHMQQVAEILETVEPAPTVHMIDLSGLDLPPKGDAVEYIASFDSQEHAKVSIEAALEFAEPMGLSKEMQGELEDIISGKRKPVPFFGWPAITNATKANKPGGVTLLCGSAGATKSFWMLQAFAGWYLNGIKCALMELEEDKKYHMFRAVAQYIGNANICDEEWIEGNPAEARKLFAESREFMNGFGRCLYSAPTADISPDELLGWLNDRCRAGCRMLGIDPITAMDCGKNQWIEDLKFLTKAKRMMSEAGASLILVTHPKKGAAFQSMDELAGSAAYPRFSRTVLWLEASDEETGSFRGTMGSNSANYNREMKIRKARESWGNGKSVGFFFDKDTFLTRECGIFAD
jgi:hypothetical protein